MSGLGPLTMRELKKWYRNPVFLITGLIQPFFWVALFGSAFDFTKLFSGFTPPGISVTSAVKRPVIVKTPPNAVEVTDSGPNSVRIKVENADNSLPDVINYISSNGLSTIKLTVQKPFWKTSPFGMTSAATISIRACSF